MIDLGIITTAACVNVVPPADPRCSDPAFAIANPGICGLQSKLVIKPSSALACELGSVQFKAFLVSSTNETDVTADTVFATSDAAIAIVGAKSGSATGTGAGVVNISATYQTYTAYAELTIMAGTNCCSARSVAFMILVDVTKSMAGAFGSPTAYSTRLAFARAAVTDFISKIDSGKDKVGLMTFTGATDTLLAAITSDKASVAALVSSVVQTTDTTALKDAITAAIAALNATAADERVLVIVSDGEDETANEFTSTADPIAVSNEFKTSGGIVMCLGVRASATANGYAMLSALSTGGFFINAIPSNADAALAYFTGLMGYICAGDCTPDGDTIVGQGALDFDAFQHWDVSGGTVDLLGNGFFDVLPGNGLYVNLAGTSTPHNGLLTGKDAFSVVAGHTYRITLKLAGNQVESESGAGVQVSVVGATSNLLQHIVMSDYVSGFSDYSFSFTALANDSIHITIQESDAPGGDPKWGCLLKSVRFQDVTAIYTLFSDDFSGDNLVYVPPRCGTGTTYIAGYGYYTGTDCAYTDTCLSSPPPVQATDPNPLGDLEASGGTGEPTVFNSTKQYCAACDSGFMNLSTTPMDPAVSDSGPSNIQATLAGLTWKIPVDGTTSAAKDPADQAEAISGQSGTTYTARLRIRGIVETKQFANGPGLTTSPATNATSTYVIKVLPLKSGAVYPANYSNEYLLVISDPPAQFALNNFVIGTPWGMMPNKVDYQFDAPIKSGATVTLRARTIEDHAFPNSSKLVITPGPGDPPINVDQLPYYPGQFLQMDVVSVTGGSTPSVLPYVREFTFTSASTVHDYTVSSSNAATNYPTDWVFQGSNDATNWTTLDERAAMIFQTGQTLRFPVEAPGAYLYYRISITGTTDGLVPSLAQCNLYPAAETKHCESGTGVSVTSQADADAQAVAAAKALAQSKLNCQQVFTSTQSFDAVCSTSGATITKTATALSFNSKTEADAAALATAKDLAHAAALLC